MPAKTNLSHFNSAFHKKIDYTTGNNVVSSPLGVWLALAQAASPAPQNLGEHARTTLQNLLGVDMPQAYTVLSQLLAKQPDALRLAMGAWIDNSMNGDPHFRAWQNNLPDGVRFGSPVPQKEVLDRWVKESSLGILPEFPADEEALRNASIVLANVLATKFNWREPFKAVKNTTGVWDTQELLYASDNKHHVSLTYDTDGELYGIVTNYDETAVEVHAVIAANKDLPAETVIAFAEKWARADYPYVERELPESGPIHTSKDVRATRDRFTAQLPAWSANSTHDLTVMGLPLVEAVSGITPEDMSVAGVQVAAAAYNKRGFEAAAVTAIVARAAGMPPQPAAHKQYDITFAHPFAVVAAQGYNYRRGESLWDNLPVFTAWVAKADEVSDKDFTVER